MADEAAKVEPAKVEPAKVESATEATPAKEAATATKTAEDAEMKNSKTDEPKKNEDATADKAKGETVPDEKPAAKDTSMLKTSRYMSNNRRKNIKYDPGLEEVTDDPVKIRGQVEFYFSDSNLPTDEFLWNLTGGPDNNPIDLKKICTFKRMRRFQPYEAIVKALRDSRFLTITGEEGHEMVSRKHAYDPNKRQDGFNASVYVKGFGDEEPSTLFEIEAFFAKFGTVNQIRLRRTDEGLFKGSVFVEFPSTQQADSFLALDPPPKWKGHDLMIMSKGAYVAEKNRLIDEGLMDPTPSSKKFFEGRHGKMKSRMRRDRRDAASTDWKTRREEDRKHGFRDRRDRNDRRGGRGGRGRGGRYSRGDDRREDRREDRIKEDEKKPKPVKDDSKAKSPIKRGREDDNSPDERPAKKVDAKAEVGAEAS